MGRQLVGPFLKIGWAYAGDWMGAYQVRKVGHSHEAGVSLRRSLEHVGDDGGGGKPLLLQGDSVVQTARRATPSIANAGNDHVGAPVKVFQHLRMGRQRRRVLLGIEYLGELEFLGKDSSDGP